MVSPSGLFQCIVTYFVHPLNAVSYTLWSSGSNMKQTRREDGHVLCFSITAYSIFTLTKSLFVTEAAQTVKQHMVQFEHAQ